MKINTLIQSGHRSLLPVLALLCAAAIGACNVTQPDENNWSDVRAYSWPTGKYLTYDVYEDLQAANQTLRKEVISTRLAHPDSVYWNGERFYTLKDTTALNPPPRLFLPMKDTLVMRNPEFPSDLALVAPLVKKHSWISGYAIDGTPWRATIMERYSYRKIQDIVYQNVLEVEYRPESTGSSDQMEMWTYFYAEGKGVVQKIQSLVDRPWETPQPLPKQVERAVLVSTNNASN